MIYVYIQQNTENGSAFQDMKDEIFNDFLELNELEIKDIPIYTEIIPDTVELKDRPIFNEVKSKLRSGDILIVPSLSYMGEYVKAMVEDVKKIQNSGIKLVICDSAGLSSETGFFFKQDIMHWSDYLYEVIRKI